MAKFDSKKDFISASLNYNQRIIYDYKFLFTYSYIIINLIFRSGVSTKNVAKNGENLFLLI